MTIAEQRQALISEIASEAEKWQRNSEYIRLIAVSKKQPPERIDQALAAGHRLFGENRVQEAIERWEGRKQKYPDLELHLIGPLQTNKVRQAVSLFDCIQSLDRPKLASALTKEMDQQNRRLPCLIQVNTGEEDQKSGVLPAELGDFLHYCQDECQLDIQGLMCIPPLDEPPAMHFALLDKLAGQYKLKHRSMGMSGDYLKALPLGATYLRIGSAFFGKRD
jgi:hypothetical protein